MVDSIDHGLSDQSRFASESTTPARYWFHTLPSTFIYAAIFGMLFVSSVWSEPVMKAQPDWRSTVVQESLAVNLGVFSITATIHGAFSLFNKAPRIITLIGVLSTGIGLALAGFAILQNQMILFYIGFGAISGFGMALVDMSAFQHILENTRPEKRGFAGGWFAFSAGLGSLILTEVAYQFSRFWNAAVIAFSFGGIVIVLGIPWIPWIRIPSAQETMSGNIATPRSTREIVLSLTFLLTSVVFFANVFVGWAVVANLAIAFQAHGMSYLWAVNYSLIALSCYCLGRLVVGPLSDFVPSKRIALAIVMGLGLASVVAMSAATQSLPSVGTQYILGMFGVILFSYGGCKSIIGPFYLEIYGVENLGSVLGLHALAYGIGAAGGPIVLAYFDLAFFSNLAVGIYVVGIITCIAARPLPKKQRAQPTEDPDTRMLLDHAE